MRLEPLFMSNKDWYIDNYDVNPDFEGEGKEVFVLTELGKSIPEVVESYDEYFEELQIDGLTIVI